MSERWDRGTGRHAVSVVADYARLTYVEFSEDRIAAVAAGVTFFGLLALFPALASIVSLYGLFADRSMIAHTVDALAPYVPGGTISVLDAELQRLITEKPAKLDVTFFSGMAIALWSASGGVKVLIDGLNIAFERKETRRFPKLTGHALLFTAAGIVATIAAVYLSVVVPDIVGRFAFSRAFVLAFDILRWPAAFVIATLLRSLIYRIGPDRTDAPWISSRVSTHFGATD
jgi:membrane protein